MTVERSSAAVDEMAAERLSVAAGGQTLGVHAYQSLRRRLLRGEWLPGTKLTLRGLADELGTSVQPIREAVSRLAAENALILRPNHSLVVPALDRGTLDDVWSLRILLEGEAARLCTPRLTEADFRELDEAMESNRLHHGAQGQRSERVEAVQRIALLIARRSGSALLAEQIENLRLRSAPSYAQAMHTPPEHDEAFVAFTIRTQAEMIDVMRARNAERACDIRRADLYLYQRYVYRRLGLD